MANGVQGLVNDPDFLKLSAADQRKALAGVSGDARFNQLSDADLFKFTSSFKGGIEIPNALAQAQAFTRSQIKPLIPGTGDIDPTGGFEAAQQSPRYQEYERQSGSFAGAVAGGLAVGPLLGAISKLPLASAIKLLGRGAGVGVGTGTGALVGGATPNEALQTAAVSTALSPPAELLGAGVSRLFKPPKPTELQIPLLRPNGSIEAHPFPSAPQSTAELADAKRTFFNKFVKNSLEDITGKQLPEDTPTALRQAAEHFEGQARPLYKNIQSELANETAQLKAGLEASGLPSDNVPDLEAWFKDLQALRQGSAKTVFTSKVSGQTNLSALQYRMELEQALGNRLSVLGRQDILEQFGEANNLFSKGRAIRDLGRSINTVSSPLAQNLGGASMRVISAEQRLAQVFGQDTANSMLMAQRFIGAQRVPATEPLSLTQKFARQAARRLTPFGVGEDIGEAAGLLKKP